jgi:hypothetical protein
MTGSQRIDVKAAVASAVKYFREFEGLMPVRDIRLEEVELNSADDWLITLSAVDMSPTGPLGPLAAQFGSKRIYKIFRIDSGSGEVKSMKVRAVEPIE